MANERSAAQPSMDETAIGFVRGFPKFLAAYEE
jgi:hypothetical protein